jgi:hypothetical protein
MATVAAATWPASFTVAGRSKASSSRPSATTMVAPRATPLRLREKSKLKSTVIANAA